MKNFLHVPSTVVQLLIIILSSFIYNGNIKSDFIRFDLVLGMIVFFLTTLAGYSYLLYPDVTAVLTAISRQSMFYNFYLVFCLWGFTLFEAVKVLADAYYILWLTKFL